MCFNIIIIIIFFFIIIIVVIIMSQGFPLAWKHVFWVPLRFEFKYNFLVAIHTLLWSKVAAKQMINNH